MHFLNQFVTQIRNTRAWSPRLRGSRCICDA